MADKRRGTDSRMHALRPLARLFPYALRYRRLVAGAVVALLLAAGATLVLPLAVRRMIDNGFTDADVGFINNYFTMLLVIAGVLALASAMRYYFVITIGERVVSDLRRDVFSHVTSLSPSFFDTNKSGEIVSRLSADTTQIKSAVGATASMALRNTILCLGAVIMMIVTSPELSGLVLLAIPVIVFPLVGFGRSVRGRSREAQDTLAEATAYASEAISASRTVQAFNGEPTANRRYSDAVETAFGAARNAVRARALLTGFAILMIFGSVIAILWFGAHKVLVGNMSAGTLGQFLLYSLLAAGSLGTLSEVWGEISQAAGAAERLTELIDEVPVIAPPAHPKPLPQPPVGSVSLTDVVFSYPARPDEPILNGLSFEVKPGETLAIVGPSGAGKSTLFSLISRFYDPEKGVVRLDGVDVRDADPSAVRHRLASVPQDVAIFATSIRDNIAFGRPDATGAEIVEAAKAAQADPFISRMEDGYETRVGERGITLSGGQRQRIAIARAVLKDAPVLLLDEATSALDAESETLVQKALNGLMQGRTTLVIAHRLATVKKADRILVMDHGRIVEEGTHASLVKKGGLYARLARLQFHDDEPRESEAAQ
ncbi:ABC transporter transmembrane domain-containing protein [Hoeflea sp. E7-10]|uniref:ABC transporter transmembrane domain-containing protein n=2 Tax=Hoeflea poritis TaxID=2993659 RepID=A0ABT4VR51_9HYPH|nr:ABC transporter transmembrane domain-containing protein [Hoeflea poritis]MDA4847089.1 ABC transporter transmembrane domain-containing protein [Hoeflea poritis]